VKTEKGKKNEEAKLDDEGVEAGLVDDS